ncbi:MAG: hypothetical protein ABFD25_20950 [Clostridiaceae bacterium]
MKRMRGKGSMDNNTYRCVVCGKIGHEGEDFHSVMNRGGDFEPCCSFECAEKQKGKIVDHARAMLTLLESQNIEKDIW